MAKVTYLWTAALVAAATGLGTEWQGHLAAPDVVMLYLLVIGTAAAVFGRRQSLLASALSVLAYNFFFVPPLHTFAVAEERHLLTFVMMFVVGFMMSGLTLRIRKEELRARTEEMRSSLLSAVSHDLRTPLAVITGAATTLRQDPPSLGPERKAELLETICEEAARLERLVRNLLDMTRLQSGALQVRREWVPLEEIIGSALGRLDDQLAGRPIHTDLPSDLPLSYVDPVLMEQVFVNLLENAAKYTPEGTPVEITARPSGAALEIEIADHGPGVAVDAGSRIFEKFSRGQHGDVPGVGLGLAICRGVVEVHEGTLVAENRPGGGAVFRIRIPLPGNAPAVPREVLHEDQKSA